MSIHQDNDPLHRASQWFLGAWPIYLIIILALLVMLFVGKYKNSKMTDQDIVNYTISLGAKSDCYFDNVSVHKNTQGLVESIVVKDNDFKIDVTPYTDPQTKKVTAYKLSREQIMFCTKGMHNYKTPFVTLDRVLSELPEQDATAKAQKFNKDRTYKRIIKIGNYLMK